MLPSISYPTNSRPASLPPEILFYIFRFTQPELHKCNPSILSGPRSPWLSSLRTKKALALVCKTWADPATELLYADIVLWRMGQFTALANTLRTQSLGPGGPLSKLVRSLRIDSCIILEQCSRVVGEDLEFLLCECTCLRSFSFQAPCVPYLIADEQSDDTKVICDAFIPDWIFDLDPGFAGGFLLDRLASGLTDLNLGVEVPDLGPLTTMFTHAIHLTSLSLGSICALPSELDSPAIHFPALKTLQVYINHQPFTEYITTQWRMPKLDALTCIRTHAVPLPISLVASHGSNLEYLNLCDDLSLYTRPPGEDAEDGTALLPLLDNICPLLEHIILPIQPSEFSALSVRSRTLRYLDIIHRWNPTVQTYKTLALSADAHAPMLKSVRLVQACWSAPYIPAVCHPSLCLPARSSTNARGPFADLSHVPDYDVDPNDPDPELIKNGGVVHVFSNARMRQQAWAVGHEPDSSGLLSAAREEDDSDDEYVPPDEDGDDSDDGTSWISVSDSELGSCVGEDLDWSEYETDSESSFNSCVECHCNDNEGWYMDMYDRETVLRMFRVGLERDESLQEEHEEEE